jgi:WD40-like Beta Propeller Repeat
MNANEERQLRAWLDARDPGDVPARMRMAAQEVADLTPRGFGIRDFAHLRVLGRSVLLRPLVVALVLLAVALAIMGGALLYRWLDFPPKGLIAYTVALDQTGSTGIRLIAANGTGGVQVTASTANLFEHLPRWSPDGRTLVFARMADLDGLGSCYGVGSIVLYDVASGTERIVATGLRSVQVVEWSPSGDRVAFVEPVQGCSTSAELEVIDVASGDVTSTPLVDGTWTLKWSGEAVNAVAAARFDPFYPIEPGALDVRSPDGTLVAAFDGPGRDLAYRLRVTDSSTGTIHALVPGGSPAWAPDGTAMAFVEFSAGPSEPSGAFRDRLAIVEAGSWNVRTLADVMVVDVPGALLPRLRWTGDGRAVYWMDVSGGHVADIASGRVVDLPADMNGCDDFQWQPTGRDG